MPLWCAGVQDFSRQTGLAERALEYPAAPHVEKSVCGRRPLRQAFPLCVSAVRVELQPGDLPWLGMAVIKGVLSRRGIRRWVNLDDILLSARRRGQLRRAVRKCATRLRRAGFIVGDKSDPTPNAKIGFIGKYLDTRAVTISNAVGALVGAFSVLECGGWGPVACPS